MYLVTRAISIRKNSFYCFLSRFAADRFPIAFQSRRNDNCYKACSDAFFTTDRLCLKLDKRAGKLIYCRTVMTGKILSCIYKSTGLTLTFSFLSYRFLGNVAFAKGARKYFKK